MHAFNFYFLNSYYLKGNSVINCKVIVQRTCSASFLSSKVLSKPYIPRMLELEGTLEIMSCHLFTLQRSERRVVVRNLLRLHWVSLYLGTVCFSQPSLELLFLSWDSEACLVSYNSCHVGSDCSEFMSIPGFSSLTGLHAPPSQSHEKIVYLRPEGRAWEGLPITKEIINPPQITRSGFGSSMKFNCPFVLLLWQSCVDWLISSSRLQASWGHNTDLRIILLYLHSKVVWRVKAPTEFVLEKDGWKNEQSGASYFLTKGLYRY